MKPADINAIHDVTVIQGFLPYLEADIHKQMARIDQLAFSAIGTGKMTPELALNYWMEKRAMHTVLRGFQTRIKVGQSVGAEHADALTENLNHHIII